MTRLHTLLAILLCLVAAACSGDDENNGSNNSTTPDSGTSDDAGSADDSGTTTADMGAPDLGPPACEADPMCEDDERQIGCECVQKNDRACFTDADCRPDETCQEVEGDRICWWEAPPVRVCPGSEGCDAGGDGQLRVGAVSKIVTPDGFETPRPAGLDDSGAYLNFGPGPNIGDRWRDCGYDNICPDDPDYPGPDEGEGDGLMQGIWIAGFSNGRPAQLCPEELIGCDGPECCVSKWAHDDIRVQIAVVERDDVTIAFAVLDTVGFFHTDIEAIRREVQAAAEVDLLVMAATHNHEGPDTAGQWGPGTTAPSESGRSPRFLDKVRTQTVAGIQEAIAALEPATAEAAIVDEGITGLAMSDSRTPYIYDDNIPVVRFVAEDDGTTIATLLSVANHAEVRWSGNTLLTSDFFHFARKYIEEGLPEVTGDNPKPALTGFGGVTVMFAGAVGGLINPGRGGALDYADQAPADEHSWEATDAVGQRVAANVLAAAANGEFTQLADTELRFGTKRFLSGIRNTVFQLAAWVLGILDRDIYNVTGRPNSFSPGDPMVQSQVAVVRLGPVTFFTAPGEVFPETLVGGFPGGPRVQDPTVGDVEEVRVAATCDADGLPTPNDDGTNACIVRKDAENPPDWQGAPTDPIYAEIPGEYPFFIGLGMDFLGYMVPAYDYEAVGYFTAAPGDHYEETNGVGPDIILDWKAALRETLGEVE
jgi:hypothetical protein